ncbi:DUF2252 domain-containing protein [Solicola gregarius]|uniref:DUF2252 domain-containing protein n=1 Tax=Solicola gregarius TaxID=2908642 RepID=A0AA46TJN3_9ACTN|nr:DUF2252 domain-containing protein [Solicola gregarius]UYM06541.1 DUF2252 domain-containing protein [Solicola gregarius]
MPADRQQLIIDTLDDAFRDLMVAAPLAFRTKFRKMAADPFAFYRGSASLFYADMASERDRWADDRTERVWIHGDLHAENFGTYMNSHGVLVFDVNDFDEAYVGHFSWDVRRFVASLALLGWRKALPEESVHALARSYLQAYVGQVHAYVEGNRDSDFALRLDNTDGALHQVLQAARRSSRIAMLDSLSVVTDDDRRFADSGTTRRLDRAEYERALDAFGRYLETIPQGKRQEHSEFYAVKDIVGKTGFGIGSAGLPAYNVLLEGYNQAFENDVVLTMKQANVPAVSRIVDRPRIQRYFEHEGHRTAVSQRALQVHADPFLGYTTVDDVGYVVDELSPYERDLGWGNLTEPTEIEPVVTQLGRATAKIHCVSDADSEQDLVDFQTEAAIVDVIGDGAEFVDDITEFGIAYADRVRDDHALFVEAFRAGGIGGVAATG